jgi:DNA-binding Lrp family transcriptional regulator
MTIKFDELDKKLILLLSDGTPINMKNLGAQLNISMTPLRRRIAKLERAGYLRCKRTIDQSKFPHCVAMNLHVLLKEKTELTLALFEAELSRLDCVTRIELTGSLDYSVYCLFRDKLEKDDFLLHKICMLPGIRDYKTDDVLKTIEPRNFRFL